MSYFNEILSKRDLSSCPLPLWKLKITKEEYEELKSQLAKQTRLLGVMPFSGMPRECMLFFAEYWRREYIEGSHSKHMVFDALTNALPIRKGMDLCEMFYETAKRGAKILKIEFYENGSSRALDSMLYQGGLPMNLVIAPETNSVWDRFTKGLVIRNIDFDDLNLGLVAANSQSMRAYCSQLCDGIDAKQFMMLPFYCKDKFNPWFQFLLNTFTEIKRNHRQSHPFTLDWEFTLDNIEQKLSVKYDLKGLQRLSNIFLEQQNLKGFSFLTVSIRKNEKAVDSFDFQNGFSRYEVRSKHPYFRHDVVSLYLNEQALPHISESLDMSTPHLLYRTNNGTYKFGNQIGKEDSVLLVSECWSIQGEESYQIKKYQWNDIELKGIIISENFDGEIVVESKDDRMTFCSNTLLYWTELMSSPKMNTANIIEPVYDAKDTSFRLCYDSADTIKSTHNIQMEFRNKWQSDWCDTPSYGEIIARAKDSNGNFVTPIRIINVGEELTISVVDADHNTCKIRVEWPYGNVLTHFGKKQVNDVWLIKKEDCSDFRKIPFEFTPSVDCQNRFTLNIKSPFKDFSIDDINGEAVQNESWIPYSDLDKFQYHLVGMNIKCYKFGNQKRRLKWIDDKLYILKEEGEKQSIPYEGSLVQLFGSREQLRAMLERTSKNMLWASIHVEFMLEGGQCLEFEIKDSPYRLLQQENKVIVTGNGKIPINYKRALKLMKLDDPKHEALTLTYNSEEGFVLPEEIRTWNKTIVVGRSRGRIIPVLVDLNREMNREYRHNSRENAIAAINNQIDKATMGDSTWTRIIGWFERTQKEDIPASSLLDLYCVSQHSDALIKLAFQLYCKTRDDEERDTLLDQLKCMSDDLAFQWFWLLPLIREGLLNFISMFIKDLKDSAIIQMYVQWAIKQGSDMNKYLSAIADETYFEYASNWLMQLVNDFEKFMQALCVLSMQDAYIDTKDESEIDLIEDIVANKYCYIEVNGVQYVDENQDSLDEETKEFFMQYQEENKPANEQWMLKRVKAIADHLTGKQDILNQGDEVRRSLIFCYKSTKDLFLVELNNRLIH